MSELFVRNLLLGYALKTDEEVNGLPAELLEKFNQGEYRNVLLSLGVFKLSENLEAALLAAAAALSWFVQANITGPKVSKEGIEEMFPQYSSDEENSIFDIDGELPGPMAIGKELLVYAKETLEPHQQHVGAAWLLARAAVCHQKVMRELCASLKAESDKWYAKTLELMPTTDAELVVAFLVERAASHNQNREFGKAKKLLEKVQQVSGVMMELRGGMGKRTKYQEDSKSQLYLCVNRRSGIPEADPKKFPHFDLPAAATLEDDSDLLEFVRFDEGIDAGLLAPVEQAAALQMCAAMYGIAPKNELMVTECLCFVVRVLRDPTDFAPHSYALLLRSRLEAQASKTTLRSLTQLEELCAQFEPLEVKKCVLPPNARVARQFMVNFPSFGALKRELALRYSNMGFASMAATVFTDLNMREETVLCVAASGDKAKAESMIREYLTEKQTPEMLCVLGDVTNDPEQYRLAWEKSGRQYARAMRSLGTYHMNREEWELAIQSYQRALAVNSLFDQCWFALGCAAMKLSEWEVALGAFSRVVGLNSEDGEAWSNIAAVHMHTRRPREACMAMREALKQKPNNLQIWENYLLLSSTPEVADFQAAIYAVSRILDINQDDLDRGKIQKRRALDPRSICMLCAAVTEDIPNGTNTMRAGVLAKPLADLLDRVETESDMSGPMWDVLATYSEFMRDAQGAYRRRSCQCKAVEGSWPGDAQRWKFVSNAYISFGLIAINLKDKTPLERIRSVLNRACAYEVHRETQAFQDLVAIVKKLESL